MTAAVSLRPIQFEVFGVPGPQGSKRNQVRDQAVRLVESSAEKVQAWRARVIEAATDAMGERSPLDEPVAVALRFILRRPVKAHRSWRWHRRQPDLDKLVRATLDALTGVALRDDALVVSLAAEKRYAAADSTGCRITLVPLGHLEAQGADVQWQLVARAGSAARRHRHIGLSEAAVRRVFLESFAATADGRHSHGA